MPFRVEDFKGQVRELARGYQFEMEVIFPQIIGNSEMVNILVHSTTMPGREISPTSDTSFMGLPYKLAADIKYNTSWTINFRVDDNYDVIKKWKAWAELVHGTETNIAAFPRQYKSNINFYRLDGAGNRIVAITLNGAWPKELKVTTLDTKNRAVQDANVVICYDNNVISTPK